MADRGLAALGRAVVTEAESGRWDGLPVESLRWQYETFAALLLGDDGVFLPDGREVADLRDRVAKLDGLIRSAPFLRLHGPDLATALTPEEQS